jgi:2-phosphoglycerate kinase
MTDWRVLLIAGPSGTGKSTAAQAIGRRLGISVLQADEVRLALQRVTTVASHPALHRFLDAHAALWNDPAQYAEALVAVAEAVSRALEPVIEHRSGRPDAGRLIIEGDGILPALVHHRSHVRAVVVVERDASALRSRMARRGRGFEALAPHAQTTAVRGTLRFAEAMEASAAAARVPTLEAAPLCGLPDRILVAVNSAGA